MLITVSLFFLLIVGICSQCVVYILYGLLLVESENMHRAEHKLLRQIKTKYKNYYSLNMQITNVEAFLGRMFAKYDIFHIPLSYWKMAISWCAFIALGIGWASGRTMEGFGMAFLLILFEKVIHLKGKEQLIIWNIEDFLGNNLQHKLESEEQWQEKRNMGKAQAVSTASQAEQETVTKTVAESFVQNKTGDSDVQGTTAYNSMLNQTQSTTDQKEMMKTEKGIFQSGNEKIINEILAEYLG